MRLLLLRLWLDSFVYGVHVVSVYALQPDRKGFWLAMLDALSRIVDTLTKQWIVPIARVRCVLCGGTEILIGHAYIIQCLMLPAAGTLETLAVSAFCSGLDGASRGGHFVWED